MSLCSSDTEEKLYNKPDGEENGDNSGFCEISEMEKLLKVFVKYFVNFFEVHLKILKKVATLDGKAESIAVFENATLLLTGIGGLGGFASGIPGGAAIGAKFIGGGSKYILDKINDYKNIPKAKKIVEIFRDLESDIRRKILVNTGGEIFWCFQNQMRIVTDVDKINAGAMEKLSADAVDRIMNYICENPIDNINKEADQEKVFQNLITKGVIQGKSKERNIMELGYLLLRTDKVKKRLEDKLKNKLAKIPLLNNLIKKNPNPEPKFLKCTTTDLYEQTGILYFKINANDVYEYFKSLAKKSDFQNNNPYWYRIQFDWEYCQSTTRVDEYDFILKREDLKKNLNAILGDINKSDQEFSINEIKKQLDKLFIYLKIKNSAENNKSVRFDLREPVKSFIGRSNDLLTLQEKLRTNTERSEISHTAVISGLGGIGKSELARKYASENCDYYENIIWIKAETTETQRTSFQKLNKKELKSFDTENMDSENLVNEVYRFFGNRNSLFIFDNADKFRDIKEFLPKSLPKHVIIPHVLITSRNQAWDVEEEGTIEIIKLNQFSEKESIEFITKALEGCNVNSSEQNMNELAQVLQYFPLALAQATSYIKKNSKQTFDNEIFEIKEYLMEYKQEKQKEEDFLKLFENTTDCRYIETLLTTWNVTLNKLKDNKNAINIIEILSYLAPDSINVTHLFSKIENYNDAFILLDQYSMINLKQGISSINTLVQKIIRVQIHQEKGKTVKVIKKVFDILESSLNNVSVNDVNNCHITSVWNYASDYKELIDDYFSKDTIPNYYLSKLTPIHLLAKDNNASAIQKILNHINLRAKQNIEIVNIKNKSDETSLFIAAKNGHLDVIKILKHFGAKIDSKSKIIAAFHGHVEVVKFLIDEEDPNFYILHSQLYSYVRTRNSEKLKIFMDNLSVNQLRNLMEPKCKGVYKNFLDKEMSPLQVAAYNGYLDIVKLLIEKKANINCSYLNGYTALHAAASTGYLDVVKHLIENGAYINAVNLTGRTVLHAASKYGQLEVVKYLINEKDFSVDVSDKNGSTSLHTAAFYGKLNIVQFLLGKKSNLLNAIDDNGATPIICAMINCNTDVVEFLLHQQDINIHSKMKPFKKCIQFMDFSLFFMAIAYNRLNLVTKLVEKEGLHLVNYIFYPEKDNNFTAMHVAAYYNSSRIIKYFIEIGAEIDKEFQNIIEDSEIEGREPFRLSPPSFFALLNGLNILYKNEAQILNLNYRCKNIPNNV